MSHDDVRRIAPGLPERTSRPRTADDRCSARRSAWIGEDPETLVHRVESEDGKVALIANRPAAFCTTDHDDGAPVVLVRLDAVDATERITDTWRVRQPNRRVARFDADDVASRGSGR